MCCLCHLLSFRIYSLFTVTRVVRVISQLRGNMFLIGIGGSGRQSLSKIAAFICGYRLFQVEVTKQYRKQEFREGKMRGKQECSSLLWEKSLPVMNASPGRH